MVQKFVTAFTDENKSIITKIDDGKIEDKMALAKITSKLNDWVSKIEAKVEQIEGFCKKKLESHEIFLATFVSAQKLNFSNEHKQTHFR